MRGKILSTWKKLLIRMKKRHPAPSPIERVGNNKTSPNHHSENFTNCVCGATEWTAKDLRDEISSLRRDSENFKTGEVTMVELCKLLTPDWEETLKLTMERE